MTAEGSGRVFLVGAGPGDPGLLTARALELISIADAILYDRLIPAEALDGARADAELLFVGKDPGGPSVPQEQTEAMMVERARAGAIVVRLKGGDPFVFGRGGEEALALRAAGVPFEVVPGVTAGIGASAYAGIPVTQRGMASAVALVTGHEVPGEGVIDWPLLAAFPGTLVLYMGVRRLPEIAAALMAGGRAASEPVAVVESGTIPGQRTVAGTLSTIAQAVQRAGVRPPSVTIVGPVAALADELAWLPLKPLQGRTVAVTRSRERSSELARRLKDLGARVVQAPVIRTHALDGPPLDPSGYDLICLTSPTGVTRLLARLAQGGRDVRSLAGVTIAAIGPGTARALADHGVLADVIPERFVAEGLVEALGGREFRRALIARPVRARETLPDALRARGTQVDVLELYETVPEPLSPRALEAALGADYITFTSSSTVDFFLQAAGGAGGRGPNTRLASIGPATSATLREHGLEPDVEAARHDIDGLVDAVLADALSREGAAEAVEGAPER